MRSRRISRITSGTSSGSADKPAATPSCGCEIDGVLQPERRQHVRFAWSGAPPDTKNTVVKSPIVQIVEISVLISTDLPAAAR